MVENLLLNIRFRHPSPELDGKDRIAYTIEKLKEAPLNLKKKIADDPGCLKSGKISGKFRALNSILEEESIKEIKKYCAKEAVILAEKTRPCPKRKGGGCHDPGR